MIPTIAFKKALSEPTPGVLRELRSDLLEHGTPPDARVLVIVHEFHTFLDHFVTATSSRDLNHLASKLDVGAIGGVFLEQLFERPDSRELAMKLLTGGISEGLMVLASRQYVRAQEGEIASLFRETAWTLYLELWRWTANANPELGPAERRRIIDDLVAPLNDHDVATTVKTVLTGRLFQILLLAHLDHT